MMFFKEPSAFWTPQKVSFYELEGIVSILRIVKAIFSAYRKQDVLWRPEDFIAPQMFNDFYDLSYIFW